MMQVGCVQLIPSIQDSSPQSFEGLSQVVAFQDSLYSGSKPSGLQGMESLMNMGVNTIICVDGVPPDVKSAKEYGIKTIHLPLKYSAPSKSQIFDLTTATKMGLERGNVYIHCHYGKHRSAASSALVSIALGFLSIEEAKDRMRVCETSAAYKGLWDAVEKQQVINEAHLIEDEKRFPSCVSPEGITAQMVAIDDAMNRLLRVQDLNWNVPATHPDIAPAADAGFIADMFRQMQLKQVSPYAQHDFTTQVINAMHHVSGLEEALIEHESPEVLHRYMRSVEESCLNCHAAFRK